MEPKTIVEQFLETELVERFQTAFNEVINEEREQARRAALQEVKEKITEARDQAKGIVDMKIAQLPEEDGATRESIMAKVGMVFLTLEAILQALEKEL